MKRTIKDHIQVTPKKLTHPPATHYMDQIDGGMTTLNNKRRETRELLKKRLASSRYQTRKLKGRTACSMNVSQLSGWIQQGTRSYANGDYLDAIEWWKRVLKVSPHNSALYFNISLAYTAMGQHARAQASLAQAATLQHGGAMYVLNVSSQNI